MNAQDRINWKQENLTRYKKVGKKYVVCNDFDSFEGLEKGWWLIKIADGWKSMRACVHPAKAELLAAIKDKEDQIMKVIRKASEARPKSLPLSEQALKDWEWFIDKHGEEFNTLEYPSIQQNAEDIIKILLEK